ncbi:MAG: heme-binding protein [Chloroflexi bacterium]|nr:heme-binding protein [Chloroflexota bacterium]
MPDLDLKAAQRMTEAAITFAQENSLRLAIAVLDGGGNVVLVTRMDGCNFLSPEIARGKAFGSAAWKLPSAELNARFGANPAAAAGMVGISSSRVTPVQGALPIWDGMRFLGAIGVSGARSDEDEAAARAGLLAAGFSATAAS